MTKQRRSSFALFRSSGFILFVTITLYYCLKGDHVAIAHEVKQSGNDHLLRPHPHKGALGPKGEVGYVHNVYHVKNHPLPFRFHPREDEGASVCDVPFGKGDEGPHGYMALQKIKIAPRRPKGQEQRVLCIVYTYSGRHEALESIIETYGHRCHGFLASSNETNITLGAVNILHEGPEAYDNMWQKVRSTWAYVHDYYLNQFDWFHMGGDNMFVVAENLIHAVTTETQKQKGNDIPIYMGGAMGHHPRRRRRFCGGGSGYTLNRRALQLLVSRFHLKDCWPNHVASDEDRIVADCLRSVLNCTHNVDEIKESRYHPLSPNFHAAWNVGGAANWDPPGLQTFHGIHATIKPGLESISSTSVSFHLVYQESRYQNAVGKVRTTKYVDQGMRRLHAIVYGLCPDNKE